MSIVTVDDLVKTAIIGIFSDLENHPEQQYFLIGIGIYFLSYITLKYEIGVVWWGFLDDAIHNDWNIFRLMFSFDKDWPEEFVHLVAYPVYYAHDYTVWKYKDDFNLRDEEQIWYFWFLCYPLLYWTTGYLFGFFADFILPFIFVYYIIEPKAFIDYDMMQVTGKQTPLEGWPRAIAMMYSLSKTVFFDTSFLEDPYGRDLEINTNTFIFNWVINAWFKVFFFEVIGIPLTIWSEITIAYQIFLGLMGATVEDLGKEEQNW